MPSPLVLAGGGLVAVCGVVLGGTIVATSVMGNSNNARGTCPLTPSGHSVVIGGGGGPGSGKGNRDGPNNPALFAAIKTDSNGNARVMLAELMGSYLESGWQDDAAGGGALGDFQIQLDAHPDVTAAEAMDPVFATAYMTPSYVASAAAVPDQIWLSQPEQAGEMTAYGAEHPSVTYYEGQGAAKVHEAYVNATRVINQYGVGSPSSGTGSGAELAVSVANVSDIALEQVNTADSCSDGIYTTSDIPAGKVYHVGDSLTNGMNKSDALKTAYTVHGVGVTQVEATDGIGINASEVKLHADAKNIKAADTAVVELGTNDYGAPLNTDEHAIDGFVNTMHSINPSIKIYWVNTYSTKLNMHNINTAIAARAPTDGYTVIDWNKLASQDQKSPQPQLQFDSELGVHLVNPQGYAEMAAFIVGKVPVAQSTTSGGSGGIGLVTGVPASDARNTVLQAASKWIGTPYSFAGGNAQGPTTGVCTNDAGWNDCHIVGFDCSGLTLYAFAKVGLTLPHLAAGQWDMLKWYSVVMKGQPYTAALPGDLIFFTGSDGTFDAPGHVAIYVGHGRALMAPQSGETIKIEDVTTSYWESSFVGIVDPFAYMAGGKAKV